MIDKEIIDKLNKSDIDINICHDDFVIIESWDQVNKIEKITGKKIDELFDNWGFSDEYSSCDNCNNHVYTQASKNDYAILNESELICGDCIRDNNNDFVDSYLETILNNPKKANTILTDKILENNGFNKCNCKDKTCEFEIGLREGSNDNPEKILNAAITKNPNNDYIFDILIVDQFDISYTLWNRKKGSED